METKKEIAQIDVEKVIRSKNPKLLKWMPRFLLRYMKKIIHQDEFNAFLRRTENDKNYDFVKAAIKEFQINLVSQGIENIPDKGGVIFVCNHPLGGLDGIAVMNEVGKVRTDMKALVNDIIMNLENLSPMLLAVNKHGKNLMQSMRLIEASYASENCTIVFPAGLVSRKQKGKIEDLEWTKSFITKAVKYKKNIIPVYVDAKNSKFFYNLASIRKRLRIKANLEMFYLVNETYKQRGKTIRLFFGEPISYTTFTTDKEDTYWANEVKKHVYSLK